MASCRYNLAYFLWGGHASQDRVSISLRHFISYLARRKGPADRDAFRYYLRFSFALAAIPLTGAEYEFGAGGVGRKLADGFAVF